MNLSDKMKTEAISLGLCQEWQNEWKDNSSKEEMAKKYIKGLDFCIEHDWPSTKAMKELFGDEVMNRNGIWVDAKGEIPVMPIMVLNGNCDVDIACRGFDVSTIWVRHNSKARIKVEGFALVRIKVFDGSFVDVSNTSNRSVIVYQYEGCVATDGNVTVKDRENVYRE